MMKQLSTQTKLFFRSNVNYCLEIRLTAFLFFFSIMSTVAFGAIPPPNDLCENRQNLGVLTTTMELPRCTQGTTVDAHPAEYDTAQLVHFPHFNDVCVYPSMDSTVAGVWYEFSTGENARRLEVSVQFNEPVWHTLVLFEAPGSCSDSLTALTCGSQYTGQWAGLAAMDIQPHSNYWLFIFTDEEDAGSFDLCLNVKTELVCEEEHPYYFNHAQMLCSEEELTDYCMEMHEAIMSDPWPGCDFCCALGNPNWFVFTTGPETLVEIEVFIHQCQNNQGTQIALYELDQDFSFDPTGQASGLVPTEDQLVSGCGWVQTPQVGNLGLEFDVKPFTLYGLVVDGWAEDRCHVYFESVTNIAAPDELLIDPDNTPILQFSSDTICLGGLNIPFYLEEEVPLASGYHWWLNGEFHSSTASPSVAMDFDEEGLNEVCVAAYNACNESSQNCTEVYVSPADTLDSFITADTICKGLSYDWIGPLSEVMVFFPGHEDPDDYYYETTAYSQEGCPTHHAELFLNVVDDFSVSYSIRDVSCRGGSDGSVEFEITGGSAPFEILLNGMDSTDHLVAGEYYYHITDAHACTQSDTLVIHQPSALSAGVVSFGHSGDSDDEGYLILEVEGGTPPYTYEWFAADSLIALERDLIGYPSGHYELLVTDSLGCSESFGFIIYEQPVELELVIEEIAQPMCYGEQTGGVILEVIRGMSPFEFDWSTGHSGPHPHVSGLIEGVYSVTVTDFFGSTAEIEFEIQWPERILTDVEVVHPSCLGCSDGSATAIPLGDPADFTYNWGTQPPQHSQTADNLPAGAYGLTVSDFSGCSYSTVVVLADTDTCNFSGPYYFNHTDLICSEEELMSYCFIQGPAIDQTPWPGCEFCCALLNPHWLRVVAADSLIQLDFDVSGCEFGIGIQIAAYELPSPEDFHYDPTQWSWGLVPESDMLVSGCDAVSMVIEEGSHRFEFPTTPGLTYGIVVDGWAGDRCKVEFTGAENIAEPESLDGVDPGIPEFSNAEMGFGSDTLCLGAIDITFSLPAHVPYATQYSWILNGDTVATTNDLLMELDLETEGFQELCVVATNKCSQSEANCIEFYVSPGSPISETMVSDTVCYGESYYWQDSDAGLIMEIPPADSAGLSEFDALLYDAVGCPERTIHLTLLTLTPVEIIDLQIEDVSCYGYNDGALPGFSVIGGIFPYGSEVYPGGSFDSLSPHEYELIVYDQWGCMGNASFVISEPPPLEVFVEELGDSGPGNDEGYVLIDIHGGTGDYTVEWWLEEELFTMDQNLLGAPAGIYTLIATDENGCTVILEGIEVEMGVGISELDSEEAIAVYPNPAGDWLRVSAVDDLGQATLTIWDVRGKELYSFEVRLSPHADIGIESLSSGLYFIQVKAEHRVHTVRFVKY